MATEYDPDIHGNVLTDKNGRVINHKYDPDANGGEGGFVAVGKNDPMEVQQTGDVATETTLDTRLNSLEDKMDTLLNSQDIDNNLNVKQFESIELADGTSIAIEDFNDLAQEITLAEIRDQKDLANEEVVNAKVSFAETAGVGDTKTVSIPAPMDSQKDEIYMISVYNGSGVAAITVDKETTFTDSEGNVRTISHNLFENLATETADSVSEEIVFMHEGADLVIINDTALDTGQGYDVYIRVVKL